MEYSQLESRQGKYDVYYNQEGKKYIVLEGLSPNDVHTPGVLEKWTHQHYDQLALMYWILFASTLAYLFYTYIFVELYKRVKDYYSQKNSAQKSI